MSAPDVFDFVVCGNGSNGSEGSDTKIHNETDIVRELINKFDEFDFLRPIANNGFLLIRNTKKKSKPEVVEAGENKPVIISKISEKNMQIMEQLSGNRYHFMIEFIWHDLEVLDINQIVALAYFELRKIRRDFSLGKARTNDWIKILHGLGRDYNKLDSSCSALLDPDFSWNSILGDFISRFDQNEEES